MTPFRIEFSTPGCVPPESYLANMSHALSLGLPLITPKSGTMRLAVVGGGPSLLQNWEQLRDYDEVWGVNHAAQWLNQRGIAAIGFTVDPESIPGMFDGVERLLLATCVHPATLAEAAGKDVQLFHAINSVGAPFIASGGPSSVCRAQMVALMSGAKSITYFGCEGSFGATTHAYTDDRARTDQIVVMAGGKEYVSRVDMYLQSQHLAELINHFPNVFKEESGGLLRGMRENPDTWEVVAVSESLALALIGDNPLSALPAYQPGRA